MPWASRSPRAFLHGSTQSKRVSLTQVKQRGLIRGLCGVITGEVKGELLAFCRIAPDGERYNTNIDMLCYELLDGIVPVSKLRVHANHLRCLAGLGLASDLLLNATRTLMRGTDHLTFLVPNAGRLQNSEHSIAQIFEQLVVRRKQYRSLLEGTRREPFNFTPMGVNSISFGSPHVRCTPMGRTCGEPRRNQEKYPPEKYYRSFS